MHPTVQQESRYREEDSTNMKCPHYLGLMIQILMTMAGIKQVFFCVQPDVVLEPRKWRPNQQTKRIQETVRP